MKANPQTMRICIYLITLISLLTGCASTPVFDATQVDKSLIPQNVAAEPSAYLGKTVLWGGIILDTRNLTGSTQLELLAYPLSKDQRPLSNNRPLGRFLINQEGFLDPAIYAQGQKLTVLGSVDNNQQGKVGESIYSYPVINAEQLQLWSAQNESQTRFSFGLGIVF
jgi:outer membrane lipoprotein